MRHGTKPQRFEIHTSAESRARRAHVRQAPRRKRSAERRDAILAAALDEFSARGFAGDAARRRRASRAGVAKGTIYLYFADKETLFQELIRAQLSPVVGGVIQASHADIPLRLFVEQLIDVFVREVFGTRRKDVIRLVITEGPRFPKLAEFYYREVIARVIEAIRALLRRARRARRAQERRAGAVSAACSPRRASSRSSGAGCSSASSRSMSAR